MEVEVGEAVMATIQGLLETALYVEDLERAADFYRRVFEFRVLLETDRLVALDVAGKNVLLLFKSGATTNANPTPGGVIPGHGCTGPTHFAFSIGEDEVPHWRRRLDAHSVAIESEVTWNGGAVSLYFRDPDGHLGELITPGFWKIF
jgi:catechol 2,3-dioxygenase-like lactoylglutathione lyase family enzyme